MNKIVDPQAVAKTMQEFEMANAKMEMTEETSKLKLTEPTNFGAKFYSQFVLKTPPLRSSLFFNVNFKNVLCTAVKIESHFSFIQI